MAVRSKRLFGPVTVTTVQQIVYTCPGAETALLKYVLWVNLAAVDQQLVLRLNGTANTELLWRETVAFQGQREIAGAFIVMHPADVLRAQVSTGTATLWGFGAELEGVAD